MSGKYEKSSFVGVRRTKISENQLSSTRENQKSAKIGFPSRGKIRNQQKSAFPREGKSKNAVGSISYSSQKRKKPESLIKQLSEAVHILHTLFRYLSTWQLLFSLLLLFGDDLVFRWWHAVVGSEAAVEGGAKVEARLLFYLVDVLIAIFCQ